MQQNIELKEIHSPKRQLPKVLLRVYHLLLQLTEITATTDLFCGLTADVSTHGRSHEYDYAIDVTAAFFEVTNDKPYTTL